MARLAGTCFRLADLFGDAGQAAYIIELAADDRAVLWLNDGKGLHQTSLPLDGGPDFARCWICGEWCYIPDGLAPRDPISDDGKIVCWDHDEYEWDLHGLA
jgi:hypothetical protein